MPVKSESDDVKAAIGEIYKLAEDIQATLTVEIVRKVVGRNPNQNRVDAGQLEPVNRRS